MPVAGRKPKPDGQKRTRHPLQHQFVDVADVPFTGGPALPQKSPDWRPETKRWWKTLCRMPHCVLWTEPDWQFAMDAARVYEQFLAEPVKAAPAMLARDKVLGTTFDARRDLRIRYVDPAPDMGDDRSVAMIDEYRDRLARLDETTDAE